MREHGAELDEHAVRATLQEVRVDVRRDRRDLLAAQDRKRAGAAEREPFGDRMLVANAVLAGLTEQLAVDHVRVGGGAVEDGEDEERANERAERGEERG